MAATPQATVSLLSSPQPVASLAFAQPCNVRDLQRPMVVAVGGAMGAAVNRSAAVQRLAIPSRDPPVRALVLKDKPTARRVPGTGSTTAAPSVAAQLRQLFVDGISVNSVEVSSNVR